jgi:hypothetical protein
MPSKRPPGAPHSADQEQQEDGQRPTLLLAGHRDRTGK